MVREVPSSPSLLEVSRRSPRPSSTALRLLLAEALTSQGQHPDLPSPTPGLTVPIMDTRLPSHPNPLALPLTHVLAPGCAIRIYQRDTSGRDSKGQVG